MTKHWYIGFAVMTLASCGGGGGDSSGPPPPVGNTPVPSGGITVMNNSYSPTAKTIATGASVDWVWNSCVGGYDGESCMVQGVTFDDGVMSEVQVSMTYSRV